MPMCRTKRVRAAGVLATVAMTAVLLGTAEIATSRAGRAGDDCLAGPDRSPSPEGHWYYHFDRNLGRKCWYLVEPQARAPTADPPPPQAQVPPSTPGAAVAAQPSPIETFFSKFSAGPGQDNIPQPAAAPGYSTQSLRPDNTDAAGSPRPVHTTRRTDADDPPAAKPHHLVHPPPAQTPVQVSGGSSATPIEQADRDALFQEFLRWRESPATGAK